VIEGERTTYYRHSIRSFNFTELDGREKWTSYKFMMGVYNDWAPSHFEKLCSAIDELPMVNFDVSQQPELLQQSELSFSEFTELSQSVEGVDIQGSSFTSALEEKGTQLPRSGLQNVPSGAPMENERKSAETFKVPRKRRK
jgi:hypothetical protein